MEELLAKLQDLGVNVGGKIILALLILIIGRIVIKYLIKLLGKIKKFDELDPTVHRFFTNAFKFVLNAILVISIIGGLFLMKRTFLPLRQIADTLEEIQDHYNDSSALYNVVFRYADDDDRALESLDTLKASLASYDLHVSSELGDVPQRPADEWQYR